MKKILILAALVGLFSISVYAEKKPTKDEAIDSLCDSMQSYAQSVMRNRQLGGTAAESIRVINQKKSTPALDNYMKAIVYDAYSEPKWETEANKENAIIEFGNNSYMQCVRALHGK